MNRSNNKKTSTKPLKINKVVKITPDFIIDLYLEIKKLPPGQRKEALEKIKALAGKLYQNIKVEI